MPAKGPLAAISRKKYGMRADHRAAKTFELFDELRPYIHPKAKVTTDQNPKYPSWLKPYFKDATHVAVKGRRGCVVGQGELRPVPQHCSHEGDSGVAGAAQESLPDFRIFLA